jgi:sugar lactone lactonase YvrE
MIPRGLAVDRSDALYIADQENHRIRKVTPDGVITTVAGKGTSGLTGDGGSALSASVGIPTAVAYARDGQLYVFDFDVKATRKITVDGQISTIEHLGYVSGLAAGPHGEVYVAYYGFGINRINPDGSVDRVAQFAKLPLQQLPADSRPAITRSSQLPSHRHRAGQHPAISISPTTVSAAAWVARQCYESPLTTAFIGSSVNPRGRRHVRPGRMLRALRPNGADTPVR